MGKTIRVVVLAICVIGVAATIILALSFRSEPATGGTPELRPAGGTPPTAPNLPVSD